MALAAGWFIYEAFMLGNLLAPRFKAMGILPEVGHILRALTAYVTMWVLKPSGRRN